MLFYSVCLLTLPRFRSRGQCSKISSLIDKSNRFSPLISKKVKVLSWNQMRRLYLMQRKTYYSCENKIYRLPYLKLETFILINYVLYKYNSEILKQKNERLETTNIYIHVFIFICLVFISNIDFVNVNLRFFLVDLLHLWNILQKKLKEVGENLLSCLITHNCYLYLSCRIVEFLRLFKIPNS